MPEINEPSKGQIRQKHSAPDNVLPPVSVLAAKQNRTLLRYTDLDGQEQVIDYGELCKIDDWPIPLPVDREGYGTVDTSPQYWATGYGDWQNVSEGIQRYMDVPPARVLDFGCATGRFLRHVHFFGTAEAHGCDFAPANVNWVKQHFDNQLNVILNSSEPVLPYPDNFFDCITAFSVFTHIDQDEDRWLDELFRIIRPGGLLYLTIQNQSSWDKVLDRPGSYDHLEKANNIPGNIHVDRTLFMNPMPQERIVFRMSLDDIYNCNVWLTNYYVQTKWNGRGEILKIAENAHTQFQSVVLIRAR